MQKAVFVAENCSGITSFEMLLRALVINCLKKYVQYCSSCMKGITIQIKYLKNIEFSFLS